MSPQITTSFIDEAYDGGDAKAGALGGKVTGAGGGGYMLFYCEFQRKHRVAEALTAHGRSVTEFAFEPTGSPPGASAMRERGSRSVCCGHVSLAPALASGELPAEIAAAAADVMLSGARPAAG